MSDICVPPIDEVASMVNDEERRRAAKADSEARGVE